MRAILFGASGQLGVDLARESLKRGHEVLAFGREECDITDHVAVRERIAAHRPDCVINAAAYNDVDLAETESEAAMSVNSVAVRTLAVACAGIGATLLHYSTDYVFAGDKISPYTEADRPCPISAYGKSKLAGEHAARANCPSHYVLRVAGVYGPPGRYTARGNFAEFVLRSCANDVPLRIVSNQLVTPTFGPALARRSLEVLEMRIPFGLYHLGGGQKVSWLEFARRLVAAAGASADIVPVPYDKRPTRARRPRFSALSNRKIETAGVRRMPTLDEAIRQYLLMRRLEWPEA